MRKVSVVLAVVVVTLALVACGETVNIGENGVPQGITVQATGVAEVMPDAVRISLSVSVLAESNDSALEQMTARMSIIRGVLEGEEVEAADIASQNVTVSPEYKYSEADGQQLVGYRATQTLDVLVRKAENAGDIIGELSQSGVGESLSINGTFPVLIDTSSGMGAAREAAVFQARQKADAYADLFGVELGDLVYLTEVSAPQSVVSAKSDAMAESAAPTIDLGTQLVTVTIEVRWKIA